MHITKTKFLADGKLKKNKLCYIFRFYLKYEEEEKGCNKKVFNIYKLVR